MLLNINRIIALYFYFSLLLVLSFLHRIFTIAYKQNKCTALACILLFLILLYFFVFFFKFCFHFNWILQHFLYVLRKNFSKIYVQLYRCLPWTVSSSDVLLFLFLLMFLLLLMLLQLLIERELMGVDPFDLPVC